MQAGDEVIWQGTIDAVYPTGAEPHLEFDASSRAGARVELPSPGGSRTKSGGERDQRPGRSPPGDANAVGHSPDSTGNDGHVAAPAVATGRGLPAFPVRKSDVQERVRETPESFELEFVAKDPDSNEVSLGKGAVRLDDQGQPKGAPSFTLVATMTVRNADHSVQIFDDVDASSGAMPTGIGDRIPLTQHAIARYVDRHASRFGTPPTTLEGRLAWSNKLNFQREFYLAKTRDGLAEYDAAQQAIRRISFGRHRVAAGYDQFVVNMKMKELVDLGPGIGKQRVPRDIEVIAYRTGGVP